MLERLCERLMEDFPCLCAAWNSAGNECEFSNDYFFLNVQIVGDTVQIIQIRTTKRKAGVDSLLLNHIIDFCREYHYVPIAVGVSFDEEVEDFWSRRGFTPINDGSRDWVHTEFPLPEQPL